MVFALIFSISLLLLTAYAEELRTSDNVLRRAKAVAQRFMDAAILGRVKGRLVFGGVFVFLLAWSVIAPGADIFIIVSAFVLIGFGNMHALAESRSNLEKIAGIFLLTTSLITFLLISGKEIVSSLIDWITIWR